MDLAQLLQECEAPDETKGFLAVTETERTVWQRLLSQEPELALLGALEALGISESTGERLAATLLARMIRQAEPRGRPPQRQARRKASEG